VSNLFSPLTLRGTTLRNRIVVSPMCMYSCTDGLPDDWHLVHLGSRAVGGAALVFTEAAAVSAEGRISPQDAGIWNDEQGERWARVTAFIRSQGALSGVQLAHAGRKASTYRPWAAEKNSVPLDQGGWPALAPSALAFGRYAEPVALDSDGIAKVIADFVAAAQRAVRVGFDVVELHAAHGYLLHEFYSPLSNQRTDEYGGSFENRIRLTVEVVRAVGALLPNHLPLLVRISATDWMEGGWTIEDSVELAKVLKAEGADLIDTSTGGNVPHAKIPSTPGYQVEFAERIRREAGVATGAVGLITTAAQAEEIVASGQADLVLLAREELRDPYFPLHAAHELGADVAWPVQYERAKPRH
jgi:2,4-dienoyl-CoA reductase-like NADH-dependent reductase (Old Yellow Enzyme family)